MMRAWIIALAVAGCAADSLLAQDGGGVQNRYEQLPRAQGHQRRYVDPNLKPAAVAAEHARRSQPSRPAASSNSGGLFGKLKLPNLIPQSLRGGNDEPADDAPLPYDQADAQPQPRSSRSTSANVPRRAAQRSPQSAAPRQQSTARSSAAPARPATTARTQPAPARTAQPSPTPRVARSSPAVSHRKNELAEALSGLTSRPSQTASAPQVDELPSDESLVPPVADDTEQLPSYLSDSPAIAASKPPRAVAPRNPQPGSRDLRDALLSEDSAEEVVTEQDAAPPTEEAISEPEEPAVEHGDLVEPPMPSTSLPAASSRKPSAKTNRNTNDAAAAFGNAGSAGKSAPPAAAALGEIIADSPNAELDANQAAKGSTATIQSKPSTSNSVRPGRGVLFTSRQPIITSNIEGPQQIVIGRQAEYRVTVQNTGDVAARDLVAAIAAPAGAELVDASASNGTVERSAAQQATSGEIRWQLYELPAGASQTLTLQLIPRGGREMQLGVQLTHAPTGGQATVEIQEPKLSMEITGPSDVQFGKSQRYALSLANPGNGAAEDIVIELTPPGGDKTSLVRHKVGTLAPGETKKIELELTARDAGELKIQAAAIAANNLRTEATKSVLCRKAELQVDWRGAEKNYAGAVATYYVRVKNPGTAPAEQVAVKLSLPTGAELVEASDDHQWDADRRVLLWKAASLAAGEERFMEVQCRMSQPGLNKIELSSQTASGDLSDAKSIPVNVEALADLKLEVIDPKGVVPVGEMATYEVRIKNRGATSAKAVNIIAMFSEGIDPSHVEGGQHTIKDGRVSFRAIDLAGGAETVFKIHAKASKSGTHIFRAEVACDELEVKLAAEETTRYFDGDQRWADASAAYAEEGATTTR